MNSSFDNSSEEVDFVDTLLYFEFILLSVAMTIVCILAIFGNSVVMLSFMMNKKLRILNNYFLLSLAISDMIIATFSMPLFTSYLLIGEWPFGAVLCDVWLAIDYMCSSASELNLVMISVDRYFSITSPLRYRVRRTGTHVAVMISFVWFLSFLIWPPWIFSWQFIKGIRTVPDDECYVQFISANPFMAVLTSVIAYYIPVTVICILYFKIWRTVEERKRCLIGMESDRSKATPQKILSKGIALKRNLKCFSSYPSRFWKSKKPQSRRTVETVKLSIMLPSATEAFTDGRDPLESNADESNINECDESDKITYFQTSQDFQASSNTQHSNEKVPLRMSSTNKTPGKGDKKAGKVLAAIVLAFIVATTPYNIVVIVKSFDSALVTDAVWNLCYFMFYVNSVLDPVCYALANKNFRNTYWRILKCSWYKPKLRPTNDFSTSEINC